MDFKPQKRINTFLIRQKVTKQNGWQKVIFAADCIYEDWDDDFEMPICPVCLIDYADCSCPGPTQEDIYNYKEDNGILYAKKKKENADKVE